MTGKSLRQAWPALGLALLCQLCLLAGCEADPVGAEGVRAEAEPNIGQSTPSSFIPQSSNPAASPPATTTSPPTSPGPASSDAGAGDDAADPGTDRSGETTADAGPMREVIPICDEDDGGVALPEGAERCAVVGDLVAHYRVADVTPADNQIRSHFNIVNHGSTAIPLAELTLRYWYTKETTAPTQEFHCDYALMGSGNVLGSFSATDLPGADHYLEIGFASGTLAAGGETGEIQTRFNTEGWADYDETDDYSYDATATAFQEWDRVTLYLSGALIWGAEPL